MIKGSSFISKSKKQLENELRSDFILASKDDMFKKLCNRLKCEDEVLMKYTSRLETTCFELSNCSKCKSLDKCKNEVTGHIYYPTKVDNSLEFSYKPCKFYKENKKLNNTIFFDTPKIL